METTNTLEIHNLQLEYRTADAVMHAVNGIDITIPNGKTLGLVGETGAGKTSTALSILRLLPERVGKITGGSIHFNGKDILNCSEAEMRMIRGALIAMIFQDPMTSLNPVLSVGKQIGEALALHDMAGKSKAEINQRVGELLEQVGIPAGRQKEYPHQFSGGMRQRVVIAMALACDPMLLIADEPTTALDVTIQAQVLRLMRDLQQKMGTATLLITHDLGVVAEMCDYVSIMYAGEIVESGTAEDIFEGTEHHPYTEGLFDSIPKLDDTSLRLKPIDGLMPDPSDLPKGCKFHPRCTHCTEKCRTQQPKPVKVGTHTICCHLYQGKEEAHV